MIGLWSLIVSVSGILTSIRLSNNSLVADMWSSSHGNSHFGLLCVWTGSLWYFLMQSWKPMSKIASKKLCTGYVSLRANFVPVGLSSIRLSTLKSPTAIIFLASWRLLRFDTDLEINPSSGGSSGLKSRFAYSVIKKDLNSVLLTYPYLCLIQSGEPAG